MFGQRFLDNPRADSHQSLHVGVLWFRMCLLPFWGLAAPGGRKKGEMEFSLLWESMGNFFSFWWFLSDISATRGHIHTIFYLCTDNVCRRAPSPLGSIGPLRAGGGELKTQKMGVVSFVLRTATISIFLSASKCGSICRAQTCAQSGIEPSRSSKAFLQGGQKVRKNFKFFTMSRVYVPISQKLLTIEAYKQRTQKKLYLSPIQLSHVYGPIAHRVLQGEPKSA